MILSWTKYILSGQMDGALMPIVTFSKNHILYTGALQISTFGLQQLLKQTQITTEVFAMCSLNMAKQQIALK